MSNATSLANNFESRISSMSGDRTASEQAFLGIAALVFVVSAVLTAGWCGSMSAMAEMPMPGGWSMSMTWMRMPGQTWTGVAAAFLGMWILMMVAMMLPSLTPMLLRYRQVVGMPGRVHLPMHRTNLRLLTLLVAGGYFLVWAVFGVLVFPLGAALASVEMQAPPLARAVPFLAGAVVLVAGVIQFSSWKAHHLACCRLTPARAVPSDAGTAWRQGLSFGMHCSYSCLNLTAILLILGVMDLRVMTAITAAITAERLAPSGKRVAQAVGVVVTTAGLLLIAQAAGFSL